MPAPLDNPARAALLVVDVQRGLDHVHDWGARNNPACEDNIAALIARWRSEGRPALSTSATIRSSPTRRSHPTCPATRSRTWSRASPTCWCARRSTRPSTARPTSTGWLQQQGIEEVVICGITTNQCCETTACRPGTSATADAVRRGRDTRLRPPRPRGRRHPRRRNRPRHRGQPRGRVRHGGPHRSLDRLGTGASRSAMMASRCPTSRSRCSAASLSPSTVSPDRRPLAAAQGARPGQAARAGPRPPPAPRAADGRALARARPGGGGQQPQPGRPRRPARARRRGDRGARRAAGAPRPRSTSRRSSARPRTRAARAPGASAPPSRLYGGELLPEDRYEDWTRSGARSSEQLREELEEGRRAEDAGRRAPAAAPSTSSFVGREHELGSSRAVSATRAC